MDTNPTTVTTPDIDLLGKVNDTNYLGKFEQCPDQILGEALYDLSLDGSSEHTGDMDYGFYCHYLEDVSVRGRDGQVKTRQFLLNSNDQGAVWYVEFNSVEDLEQVFKAEVKAYDEWTDATDDEESQWAHNDVACDPQEVTGPEIDRTP